MTIVSYPSTEFTKGQVTRCFSLFARLIAPYRLLLAFFFKRYKRYKRDIIDIHIYIYMYMHRIGCRIHLEIDDFNNSLLYLLFENKCISRDILFGFFIFEL